VLSQVKATPSHPSATPLGWDGFERLALEARLPVFALAGLGRGDLEEAWRRGAQGVAGIRGFWPGE
jgi:8-oxo-dGTP diphosphatase